MNNDENIVHKIKVIPIKQELNLIENTDINFDSNTNTDSDINLNPNIYIDTIDDLVLKKTIAQKIKDLIIITKNVKVYPKLKK